MSIDPIVIGEAVGIVICLVVSAVFSGSETALTSLSGAQAHKLIEEEGAKSLKLWVEKPIQVLTTILIVNNIVNVTASALATDLTNRLLAGTSASEWAIPMAVGIMTLLLLTFGEITPKAAAKSMAKKFAPTMMTILRPFVFFLTPFSRAFAALTRVLMRKLGNDPQEVTPFVTAEEIEYMIDLGSREGTFSEDRERMLRSVFEFNDTSVRELMVPRTDAKFLSDDLNLSEVIDVVSQCGHSRLPVYSETVDNIIGIFYVKDMLHLLTRSSNDDFDLTASLRKPFFVPESKRIADLFSEFQRQRIHMAIIVDEFGGTSGLITLEDIIEEFFGEIQDEYDAEPDQIVLMEDGSTVRADARASIYDVEDYLDIQFPEDGDYETLGGFLMAESGTVPSQGDEVVWQDFIFRIVEADEKKVIAVEIVRDTSLEEESAQKLVG